MVRLLLWALGIKMIIIYTLVVLFGMGFFFSDWSDYLYEYPNG